MIQQLTKEHLESLYEIVSSHQTEQSFPYGLSGWTKQKLEKSLDFAWGWFHGETLKSFLLGHEVGSETLEIDLLATHQGAERRGYMGHLLLHVIAPYKRVWLEVHEKNERAQKFYEKHGFGKVGERPHYYFDGGKALLYSLPGTASFDTP